MKPILLPTLLAGSLALGLAACQGKPTLALDRPYAHTFRDPATAQRDMADIQREHSLTEQQWKHLMFYHDLNASQPERFPLNITYRRASALLERNVFSQAAMDSTREANKDVPLPPPPPPLDR